MKHIAQIQTEFLSFIKIANTPTSNLYKPLIFSKTIYRQPTDEELVELNSWNLSADEIYQGFCYTMVGRGMMRQHEKYLINDAIRRLCYMYPHNNNYKQALAKAKNIGHHL